MLCFPYTPHLNDIMDIKLVSIQVKGFWLIFDTNTQIIHSLSLPTSSYSTTKYVELSSTHLRPSSLHLLSCYYGTVKQLC